MTYQIVDNTSRVVTLILISMRCLKYKDTACDLWILINYQQATDTTNGGCIFNVVTTRLLHFCLFLRFCHSRKIFTDQFVTARVDFGIAFSIKFLSSSTLYASEKLWNRTLCPLRLVEEKFKTRVRLIFLHTNLNLKCFFQHSRKHDFYEIYWHPLFQECFWSPSKKLATRVLSGLKSFRLRLVVLNPIKHSCSFFKYYFMSSAPSLE